MNKTVETFVEEYRKASGDNSSEVVCVFQFADTKELANELANLVVKAKKTATSGAKLFYDLENAPLPNADGSLQVVLNGENTPQAIIRNTRVFVKTFDEIDESWAIKEGEGDLTLEYWRKAHIDFYERTFPLTHLPLELKTLEIVCEEFEIVWT